MRPRFHLAIPVSSLEDARAFYGGILGAREGRSSPTWVDFDLWGHQLSAHVVAGTSATSTNAVDGDEVPVRHFGCILPWPEWEALADRLQVAKVPFRIAPRVRFVGEAGEQGTFFVDDPSGNSLEFKSFRDDAAVFDRS